MNPIFALLIVGALLTLITFAVAAVAKLMKGSETVPSYYDNRPDNHPRLGIAPRKASAPPSRPVVARDEQESIPSAFVFHGDGTNHEHDYSIFVGIPVEDVLSDDAVVLRREAPQKWDDSDYEGTRRRLEHAARLARAELNPALEARVLEELSNFYFQRGEYQDALRCMTDVLRLTPDSPEHKERFNELVHAHMRCERFRNSAREVLRLDAEAQRLRYDDEDEAMELAQRAVDYADDLLGPDHWLVAHALITLGCCFFDKGRSLEARDIWDQAETIVSEWQDRAPELIVTVEANLRMCRQTLGF